MTYAILEEKLKSMPEECLEKIMDYADFVLYQYEKKQQGAERPKGNLEAFFGTVHFGEDGLEIQRRMRDEWD